MLFRKLFYLSALCMFFITAVQAAPIGSSSSSSTLLRWNFQQGETFSIATQVNLDATAALPQALLDEMGGLAPAGNGAATKGTQDAQTTGVFDFDWNVTVTEVNKDGSAVINLLMTKAHVTFNAQLGQDQFSYETDLLNPPVPTGAPPQQVSEEDKTSTFVVAPNGAILSINGDKVSDSLDQFASELQAQQIDISRAQLESLADIFFNFFVRYPDKAISEGDAWGNKVNLSALLTPGQQGGVTVNQFALELAQDWKLAGINGSIADIKEMSNAMPQFSIDFESEEASVSAQFTGSESGTVLVNRESGRFQSIDRDLTITGSVTAQEKKEGGQQWDIPFTVDLRSKLNVH